MNHYSKNSLMNDSSMRDTNISRNTYFFLKESRTLGNSRSRIENGRGALISVFSFLCAQDKSKSTRFRKKVSSSAFENGIARGTRNGEDKSNADEFVTYLKKYLAHKSNTRSVDVAVVAR